MLMEAMGRLKLTNKKNKTEDDMYQSDDVKGEQ